MLGLHPFFPPLPIVWSRARTGQSMVRWRPKLATRGWWHDAHGRWWGDSPSSHHVADDAMRTVDSETNPARPELVRPAMSCARPCIAPRPELVWLCMATETGTRDQGGPRHDSAMGHDTTWWVTVVRTTHVVAVGMMVSRPHGDGEWSIGNRGSKTKKRNTTRFLCNQWY